MPYQVYILRCSDGWYYVGYADDLAERVRRHQDGRGSTFTARHRPLTVVYAEQSARLSEAVARERQLKRWTRAKKEALIASSLPELHRLARSRP